MPSDRPPTIQGVAATVLADATLHATGEVVSLNRRADRSGLTVADEVTLREQDLREWMANRVVPAFLWANGITVAVVVALVALDEINLAVRLSAAGERIIGGQVIMTLLGATTVQVGAIAYLIARYLFPAR